MSRSVGSVELKQRLDLAPRLVQHCRRGAAGELGAAQLPRQTLHLIRQDDADHRVSGRDRHLERVAFLSAGDRAQDAKPGSSIITTRRQYQRGPPAALLAALLRVE